MTPRLTLRDYQLDCLADLIGHWDGGAVRVPSVLSTGAGKTVIFAELAKRWREPWSVLHSDIGPHGTKQYFEALHERYGLGRRVLVVAHTDELIDQAVRKLRAANPGARVGVVKAAQNEVHADIVVSSRQTLRNPARRAQLRNVGLIIVDEAHHAIRSNTYGQILEHFGAFCGDKVADDGMCTYHPHQGVKVCRQIKVAGFTATFARGDGEKLSTLWEVDRKPFTRDLLWFIRRGYLLDVRGQRVQVPDFDLSRVRQSGGDYQDGALADELERTFAPEIVAREYKAAAGGRKGIAFWPLISTAEHGAAAFNAAGIPSETIHGKLDKRTRRAMLQRLHTGETQVVHGVGVLTEGFDEPTVDVVVIARPTRSAPLYQQMVGRVLRPDLTIPAEQREKALILDVAGAGAAHDLRSLIDLAPERMAGVNALDGDSLLDLDDMLTEIEETGDCGERGAVSFELEGAEDYRGETVLKEFDPLGRSQLWAQTPDGTWYMSAGSDAYAFLAPSITGDPGTFDVVLCAKQPIWPQVEFWARAAEHTALPLDFALMWAEAEAEELGGYGHKTLTGRKSAWRKKEASQKQKNMALRYGIVVGADDTAGDVSEAIEAAIAARTIDPLIQNAKKALEEEEGQ